MCIFGFNIHNLYCFVFSVKTSIGNGTVSSFLYLATATANDSGTYTCQLSNLAEAKLTLHILNGKIKQNKVPTFQEQLFNNF
jgi:hypothetical protein